MTPELWEESREHASLMLVALARAVDPPEAEPPEETSLHGDAQDASVAMGNLWACCRARLADSLSATDVLVTITLDTFEEIVSDLSVEERAETIARAARHINRISFAHVRTAATSYDAYLLEQIERANSDDRNRLARDIHDRLGTSLALALRHLDLYGIDAQSGGGRGHLRAIESALAEANDFTRSLVSGLRAEAPLTSLSEALKTCVDALNFRAVPVRILVHGDETWLPEAERAEVFMVLRECLRNSFTHAGADTVSVRVRIAPHRLDAEASDDGCGFTPQPAAVVDRTAEAANRPDRRPGSGLVVMRERTEALGGQFSLFSAPGAGTRVRFCVPLPKSPQLLSDWGADE